MEWTSRVRVVLVLNRFAFFSLCYRTVCFSEVPFTCSSGWMPFTTSGGVIAVSAVPDDSVLSAADPLSLTAAGRGGEDV